MQDSKETSWASTRGDDSIADNDAAEQDSQAVEATQNSTTETDGWQQYRRWISKAPAPRGHRMGVDPSIYTWKGYRSWSEQIKRNWSDS
jgi:hypothetical protein